MQIHELNNYEGGLNSAYLAADNGEDTGKISVPNLLAETNDAITQLGTTLNGRIDNIIAGGDAPSEAEIIDARRSYDNKNYPSLGDAIRAQASRLNDDIDDTKAAYLITNCAEMVSLFNLQTKESGGITFTPASNGKEIITTGTPSNTASYYLVDANIEKTPFVPGGKYRVKYTGPSGAYFQIISNTSNVVLNEMSFSGLKTITIPADCTELWIRLYCSTSVPNGTHEVSIVNERVYDYLEAASFMSKITIPELLQLVGATHDSLLTGVSVTDGYYVNYTNGALNANASFSATDYFRIYPGVTYTFNVFSYGSQIAYYDIDHKYVTGSMAEANKISVPNDDRIVYARWCAGTSTVSSWAIYVESIVPGTEGSTATITTADGLLEGLLSAYSSGVKNIIVKAGNYDIISEYESHYGATYFDDYSGEYNGKVNGQFDCGLWLDNIKITFESGAVVTANYTGANSDVKEWFSAFAVGQNVVIDGLVLDASELRYGIHPDFHSLNSETLEIRNCDLHHYKPSSNGVNNNQAIGAGLGVYSNWIIENCIFRSDTNHAVVRIHNNASGNAKSNIVIKDCYIVGAGFILLNSYSTSTKQTRALVSNNSWETPASVGKETEDSNDNITMYAWNNELRS